MDMDTGTVRELLLSFQPTTTRMQVVETYQSICGSCRADEELSTVVAKTMIFRNSDSLVTKEVPTHFCVDTFNLTLNTKELGRVSGVRVTTKDTGNGRH